MQNIKMQYIIYICGREVYGEKEAMGSLESRIRKE